MSNRLRVINNEIELSDLNKSYNAFKMLMKKLYLSGTPITWNKNSTFRNHEAQTVNEMNDQNLLIWYIILKWNHWMNIGLLLGRVILNIYSMQTWLHAKKF